MKFFLACVCALGFAANAQASHGNTYVYLSDTSTIYSSAFEQDCRDSAAEVASAIPAAEKGLGVASGTLAVDSQVQWVPNGAGPGPIGQPYPPYPGSPGQYGMYECFLIFGSHDAKVDFDHETTKIKSHLSKPDQATACQSDFNELSAHPGALLTIYQTGWTLFQGRICNVDHVEAVLMN
jgi:hypothetical protein